MFGGGVLASPGECDLLYPCGRPVGCHFLTPTVKEFGIFTSFIKANEGEGGSSYGDGTSPFTLFLNGKRLQ